MHQRLKSILKPFRTMPALIRVLVGLLLVLGGLLGPLPILGFWMLPLGLLVLSLDFRWARKGYLSMILWFRKRRQEHLERARLARDDRRRADREGRQ